MTSRRSAMAEAPNTITSSAPAARTSSSARGERRGLVRDPPLGDDRGAGGREPVRGDPQRLLDHLVGEAGQHRRDDADLADAIGRDAHQRRGVVRHRQRRSRAGAATANGMIFTVAIILPATTGAKAASVASVMSASTSLRRSTPAVSTTTMPALSANRLARPVKARSTRTPAPATAAASSAAATSSAHVAGLEPRHHDRPTPAAFSAAISASPTTRALAENQPGLADRMNDDAAFRFGGGAPLRISFRLRLAASRSDAVISAMIETAISGGDTAPIASPMGA